jgi:hypothetical protein
VAPYPSLEGQPEAVIRSGPPPSVQSFIPFD